MTYTPMEAKRTCLAALSQFRTEAAGHLSMRDWTLNDCTYLQSCVNRTADAILSTSIANYCNLSLTIKQLQAAYNAGVAEQDIVKCQLAMTGIIDQFALVIVVCKEVRKEP